MLDEVEKVDQNLASLLLTKPSVLKAASELKDVEKRNFQKHLTAKQKAD